MRNEKAKNEIKALNKRIVELEGQVQAQPIIFETIKAIMDLNECKSKPGLVDRNFEKSIQLEGGLVNIVIDIFHVPIKNADDIVSTLINSFNSLLFEEIIKKLVNNDLI